jgi:hypothetical protein
MCPHTPSCPEASAPDREAARTLISHPEQGWSLLCNGIVIFEDTGELLPGGDAIGPHRPTDMPLQAHAAAHRGGCAYFGDHAYSGGPAAAPDSPAA